jgi:hypothetical protein
MSAIPITLPAPLTAKCALDATIKYTVESSAIVRMGDRVARVTYVPHGMLQHLGCELDAAGSGGAIDSNSNADNEKIGPSGVDESNPPSSRSNIRARMKKRWAKSDSSDSIGTNNTSANTRHDSDASSSPDGISIDIRAPSTGFFRILYNPSTIINAVQYTINNEMKLSEIILAAIEPCEHPALVGDLCAVCGVDTRLKVVDLTADDDGEGERSKDEEERQMKRILRREHHAAAVGEGASITIEPSQFKSTESTRKTTKAADDQGKTASAATTTTKAHATSSNAPKPSVRSLSSLLSGQKSTQDMQQNRYHPPSRRTIRPTHNSTHTSNSTHSNTGNNTSHTQMTVSGGITLTISSSEAKSIAEQDAKKLKESKQLCLVLDLDHTLLHATDDVRAGRFVADEVYVSTDVAAASGIDNTTTKEAEGSNNEAHAKTKPNPQKRTDVRSILLPFDLPPAQYHTYLQRQQHQHSQYPALQNLVMPPIPSQKLRHFVKLRPHLKEFFEAIQSTYKLSVYTAGTRAYAERIAVMICRHLVGTTLDEEGLAVLRARVRELDAEWKRYRNWMERREQVRAAEERDGVEEDKLVGGEKKSVSFSVDDGAVQEAKEACPKGVSFSMDSDDKSEVNGSLNVDADKSNNDALESSKQDCTDNSHIPRKKRKAESESLISLIAPPRKTASRDDKAKTNEPRDPSEERDKLRKQLEEAEALEVEATSLRRKLFGSRIVSRTDVGDLGADVKSLKRVFPCGGVMVSVFV